MTRYPVTGPASIIECPRHGLAVALGDDGRIVSTCPACVRVAEKAEARLALAVVEGLTAEEAWSASP